MRPVTIMKSIIKYTLVALFAAAAPASALAQAAYSGYYLENYTHRFELNPAMTDESIKGFVAFPVLGNINVGMHGNLHISSILYPNPEEGGKRTLLFTNPNVPTSTVLKNIKDNNKLGASLEMDILSVGFKAFGGQNFVTLGAVADANIAVPGSLLRLMKEGVSNQTYDISDVRVNATGYAKLQFNHAREIKQVPGLKAGAAFKLLFGIANIDGYFKDTQLTLGEDAWTVRSQAELYANMGGSKWKYRHDDNGKEYVDGIDVNSLGVSGFGIGFDLGATYKWRDFEFNLALLDLGFISWSKTIAASTNGEHMVNTSDYTFGVGDGEAKATWDKMKDDLENLYQLEDTHAGARTRSLRTTLNWGVNYRLPYYDRLTFGLVNSTRFNGPFTTTDFRFSANVRPVDCLSASANFSAGTYGVGFGWLVNVSVPYFNLFLGMDHTMGKLTKQGLPLNSNAQFNFGINFPF